MQNMLEWAKAMPEHFDRLESDSLKYLKDRWAKYQKNGTAEKIETALEGTVEELPIAEEVGKEEIKIVVEQAEAMSGNVKIRVARWMSEDEFDVDAASVYPAGKVEWGQIQVQFMID